MKKYLLAALMAAVLEFEKRTKKELEFEWDDQAPSAGDGRTVGAVVTKVTGRDQMILAALGSQAHLKYDPKTGLFGLTAHVDTALLRRKAADLATLEASLLAREAELAAREAALLAAKSQAPRKKKAAEGEAENKATEPEGEPAEVPAEPTA